MKKYHDDEDHDILQCFKCDTYEKEYVGLTLNQKRKHIKTDFILFISVIGSIQLTRLGKDFLNHLFLTIFKYQQKLRDLRELRDLRQLMLLGKVGGMWWVAINV